LTNGKDKSENFIAIACIAEGTKHDFVSMLSSAFAGKIERNREILKSILKVIFRCGRQNIALRKKAILWLLLILGQKPITAYTKYKTHHHQFQNNAAKGIFLTRYY
jgi:hypothetical protein